MTREEREFAKSRIEYLLKVDDFLDKHDRESLDMAIKALSQEPNIDMESEEIKILQKRSYLEGFHEALKMSVKQQPCEDAISRDFQIGDEVRINGSDPIYDDCDVGWVIRNASEKVKTMYVMRNDGSADEECKAEWYKTGRHNAMLAEVIKELPSVTQKSVIEDIKAEIKAEMEEHRDIDDFSKGVGYGLRSAIGIIERCEDGK